MRTKKILTFYLLALILLLTACSQSTAKSDPNRIPAQVVEVIDGDTIKARFDNKTATIRFLLVDTPETHHPRLGKQPFGEEASQFTKKLLDGQEIELEKDVSPGPDKYGRYLYYIYVNGKSVQEMLLEQGLARVAYIYAPNVKYVDKYRAIQSEAQKKGLGIWSIEDYARQDGYHPEVIDKANKSTHESNKSQQPKQSNPSQSAVPKAGCANPQIKGNINKKGEKIYHLPDSPAYEKTKPEEWFCTEQEAKDAGFRKAGK
ncbi:thermonuclease family protein [Brevibacillus ginsengisoli]|uniref:thermonuclease family protein n=1 Tax=Brevibacillus ginsengisoli TaxID=363854 RepID=UPI003CF331B3